MTDLKIKVSVTDDHPVVLKGIRTMLEGRDDMVLISAYLSGRELMEGLSQEVPDVLLLDIKMPGMDGEAVAELLSQKYPQVKLVALTYLDNIYYTKLMMRRGVKGYILKTSTEEELVHAIHEVYNGKEYLEKTINEKLVQHALHSKKESHAIPSLTKREKEILQLIASNYNSKQIAEKLFLSKRTVENHRANMLLKLRVNNSASLVKKAFELNLLD